MRILGLTIARTKALEVQTKAAAASLMSVSGSRGWWPWHFIQELTTGGWQRNETISIETSLSNPTLYACLSLISGDVGKLRPKLVEQDEDGIWTEVSSPAFSPVLRKPNHYQTRVDFFEWWLLSKLIHGNTYALKARDGRGVVSALYILDPTRVQPLVSPDGSVFYQLVQDELARVEDAIVVPAREMIHDVCCPLFHPLCGVSPLYAAAYPALQGLNIRRASDKFFTNGSKPGGVLTAPGNISVAAADRLKAYWEENFSGDNIGKIAVLGDGLHYEAMAMTAEQSQLVAQLQMTDEDIAKCFHMPRYKVGVGPDPTYNNIEALNREYYTECLQKHIEKLEIRLDEGLELTSVPGRTLGVEFDLSDFLRMDSEGQMRMAAEGIKSAIFSPNEGRRIFNLKRAKGGDSPMLQQQQFSLEALAERDDAKPFLQPTAPATAPTAAAPNAPDGGAEETKALRFVEWSAAREGFNDALRIETAA